MKFPRRLATLKGPADPAAVAGSLFLLFGLVALHSSLVLPAGVRLALPEAPAIRGTFLPRFTVAVDAAGRLSFENQVIGEEALRDRLAGAVASRSGNPSLLLLADRSTSAARLASLFNLARECGITDVVLATSPAPLPASATYAATNAPPG
ncbi:MAG: ExbD/TolR family protein [Limisphaerales bacterium]